MVCNARKSQQFRDRTASAEESRLGGPPQPERVPTKGPRPFPRSCSRAQRAVRAFAGLWSVTTLSIYSVIKRTSMSGLSYNPATAMNGRW